jgi:hypothetical protein
LRAVVVVGHGHARAQHALGAKPRRLAWIAWNCCTSSAEATTSRVASANWRHHQRLAHRRAARLGRRAARRRRARGGARARGEQRRREAGGQRGQRGERDHDRRDAPIERELFELRRARASSRPAT